MIINSGRGNAATFDPFSNISHLGDTFQSYMTGGAKMHMA